MAHLSDAVLRLVVGMPADVEGGTSCRRLGLWGAGREGCAPHPHPKPSIHPTESTPTHSHPATPTPPRDTAFNL
jgi:hypothetical protein